MIKLVAFDWNGTLFSDTSAILEGVNEILRLFKLKPASLGDFQKHFDVPINKTYLGLGISGEEFNKKSSFIAETYHTFYEKRVSKTRTREGTKDLLNWISKNNIASIIFSNHIGEPIKKQLKRLKIEKYFIEIIANTHIEVSLSGRSKKDKLKSFIEDKKFLPTETLIIGDTIEEIEIGKELGTVTVAITNGNCSITRLKAKNPDYLINNLNETVNIIKKLNI